jgi:c-di-GMP-related signal transduction protein
MPRRLRFAPLQKGSTHVRKIHCPPAFRAGSQNVFQLRKEASSSVIVDSITLFDLPALTGAAKAFINLDEPSPRRGAARLLPADRVIIEILETVSPTPEVVQLCKDLCDSGYALAL